jgi:hypothetical protein
VTFVAVPPAIEVTAMQDAIVVAVNRHLLDHGQQCRGNLKRGFASLVVHG